MSRLHDTANSLNLDLPAYPETASLTRTKDGLKKLLGEAGFVDVEVREAHYRPLHQPPTIGGATGVEARGVTLYWMLSTKKRVRNSRRSTSKK